MQILWSTGKILKDSVFHKPIIKSFCVNKSSVNSTIHSCQLWMIPAFRLLAASLKYRENPKWEVDTVRMIAAQCNKQKYNAKKAGELSTELYTLKYIEMHSPLVTEAVVVEVREKYIDVIIVAVGLNRRIFFNNVSIINKTNKNSNCSD